MAKGSYIDFDTDSDDEMPAGWQEKVTEDGQVFYANHHLKTTQWEHPVTKKIKKISKDLPCGWEKKVDACGQHFFVDHINKKTTLTDPRLAFATEITGTTKGTRTKNRFDGHSTALQILQGRDLTGQHIIVTGANSGIGYETARSLALHGAHVVMACRNINSASVGANQIRSERPQAAVEALYLDFLCLKSVRQFAINYISRNWPLHVLILNAGVFSLPYMKTEDGYEATFQTNYLGQFYLAWLLKDLLIRSAPARVVIVSAESHRFTDLNFMTMSEKKLSPSAEDYRPILAYNQSKLCLLLFSNELYRRMSQYGVTSYAVHPGNMIRTHITRHWWLWKILFLIVQPFAKDKQQGAATTVYCATLPLREGQAGQYYTNCFRCPQSDEALNEETAARLWNISEIMLANAGSLKCDY